MDFDFDQIAVPFRMQPGLRRLEPGSPQLTRLAPASALYGEKRSVVEAGQSRLVVPGFDPGPGLEAIADKARAEGIDIAPGLPLELAFEEDFAILDGVDTSLPWLCVCVPSHWAPQDKLGLPFAAVHAPVADNALLQGAGEKLVQLVTGGDCWERFVWTVTPSPCYDQHPGRHRRQPWPQPADARAFAAGCWLRAERQSFFPVGRGTRQAVFTIRVMLQPLAEAVATRGQAQRLHDSLASMSDAVLDYKGLAPAREPLLRWLRENDRLMELATRIAQIIVPVLLIVTVGYFYGRHARPELSGFNRVVLDVLSPLLTYSALASKDFKLQEYVPLLAGGALLVLACGLAAWALARATGTQPRTLVPVVMFNNCGNMGLQLALLAFGTQHFGAAVALFAVSNLIHFSLGARITSAHARTRDLLVSPLMIATVLGFASAATGLRPPDPVYAGIKLMGDAALPMMLFALGVRLTVLRRRDIPRGLLGAFARPAIGLALGLPLAWALGLEGAARGQLILFAALPPAVMQFLLAERYGQEPEKVAAMILLGNAMAIVFVPLALVLAL